MPRNFRRRVEVMFPILDENLKRRVVDDILGTMRSDNVKGWLLEPNGSYQRVSQSEGSKTVRSQQRFAEIARERARETEPILPIGSRALPESTPPLDKLRRKTNKRKRRSQQRYDLADAGVDSSGDHGDGRSGRSGSRGSKSDR
jgi:polyphosphate kinase